MLPWLTERGSADVSEMARRFEVTERELVQDLELASMCGLPPYLDELIDVFIDEGVVHAGVPRVFTRPLRLTAPEGFALLTAGRAALQLPGSEPDSALARALATLAVALGDDGVVLDTPDSAAVADVVSAANDSARLRVSYWSSARDALTEREITPRAVFLDRGRWYTRADDHDSGEVRTFRIDRIEQWERTGVIDSPRVVDVPDADAWFDDADLPVATLRLDASANWVAERYPVLNRREHHGGSEVQLAVASERWLGDLLLHLGAAAEVIDPPEWRDLAKRVATTVLARYDAAES